MKRLFLCLLFVLALVLAGCESLEGERGERGERIVLADGPQHIEATIAR
jgi:hypothetical protein